MVLFRRDQPYFTLVGLFAVQHIAVAQHNVAAAGGDHVAGGTDWSL